MTTVAVLGAGTMGGTMARQLLEADHEVRVWSFAPEDAEALGEDGATVADTPAEAVEGAEVVITMVRDADAVEQAMTGDEGALEAMDDDALWLQMSTVGLEIDRLLSLAEDRGITVVDAPVFGTREAAERGELVVLAAGPDEARERCQAVFDAVGERTTWVGEAGRASRLMLVVNAWLLGLLEALAESIALAEALDVDPARFLETIENGPIDAPYAQQKGQAMIKREFAVNFPLRTALTDARLVAEAAEQHDLDAPLARVVAGQFAKAVTRGYGDEDLVAVIRIVRGTEEGPEEGSESSQGAEEPEGSERSEQSQGSEQSEQS